MIGIFVGAVRELPCACVVDADAMFSVVFTRFQARIVKQYRTQQDAMGKMQKDHSTQILASMRVSPLPMQRGRGAIRPEVQPITRTLEYRGEPWI